MIEPVAASHLLLHRVSQLGDDGQNDEWTLDAVERLTVANGVDEGILKLVANTVPVIQQLKRPAKIERPQPASELYTMEPRTMISS
jgi:hypothetical protein